MKRRVQRQVLQQLIGAGFLALAAFAVAAQTPADRTKAGVGAPVQKLTPAKDITPKERIAREEHWRQEIRQQLFVPDVLPQLNAKPGLRSPL